MNVRQLVAGIAIVCLLVISREAVATQIMSMPLLENAYVIKSAATTDQNDTQSLLIKSSGTDGNARIWLTAKNLQQLELT